MVWCGGCVLHYKGEGLPVRQAKSPDQSVLLLEVLPHLHPHVEDGAVPAEEDGWSRRERRGRRRRGRRRRRRRERRRRGRRRRRTSTIVTLMVKRLTLCRAHPREGCPDISGIESKDEKTSLPELQAAPSLSGRSHSLVGCSACRWLQLGKE